MCVQQLLGWRIPREEALPAIDITTNVEEVGLPRPEETW